MGIPLIQAQAIFQKVRVTPDVEWEDPLPDEIPYNDPLVIPDPIVTDPVTHEPLEYEMTVTPPEGTHITGDIGTVVTVLVEIIIFVDTTHYRRVIIQVPITIVKAVPVITWPDPSAIVYGTLLSEVQLNATANVAGNFVYTPGAGSLLTAGNQGLHVDFTPSDLTHYTLADDDALLVVNKADPVITWDDPAAIVYGDELSAVQLDAEADVDGDFVYTPDFGTILHAGDHNLHTDFTPDDTVDYNNAEKDVSIHVDKATPIITWFDPEDIYVGTALTTTQLNALANTSGDFVYNPDFGAVLPIGTHQLHTDFTPDNSSDYTTADKSVSLKVKGNPGIKLNFTNGRAFQIIYTGAVNLSIDWGDGTSALVTGSSSISHDCGSVGNWSVIVSGEVAKLEVPASYQENYKLTSIEDGCDPIMASTLTSAEAMFNGCFNLVSVSPTLFLGCVNITSFDRAFLNCSSLNSVPENFFRDCTGVENFTNVFAGCNGLVQIPALLFSTCVYATNFSDAFNDCRTLGEIPGDIFHSCTAAQNFAGVFSNCILLSSIPADIFRDIANSPLVNVSGAFNRCIGVYGSAPPLWVTHPATIHTGCFAQCPNLANLADIPADWK